MLEAAENRRDRRIFDGATVAPPAQRESRKAGLLLRRAKRRLFAHDMYMV